LRNEPHTATNFDLIKYISTPSPLRLNVALRTVRINNAGGINGNGILPNATTHVPNFITPPRGSATTYQQDYYRERRLLRDMIANNDDGRGGTLDTAGYLALAGEMSTLLNVLSLL